MTEESDELFNEQGEINELGEEAGPSSEDMNMSESQDYTYDELIKETEKGVCLKMGDKEQWLPKSQVEVDETNNKVAIPNWLAKDNDLL